MFPEEDLFAALTDRTATALRISIVLVSLAASIYFAVISIHWPLMCDSPVLHYVNFLMDHGMQPYQEITDNNMPGSYLFESWAMHVFGAGDLGWRMYDFFLLGVLTLAMVEISRRYDWVAGVYAGGFFLLLYGAQGPNYSVEREQVLTALFMVGYVVLFAAVRKRRPELLLLFGLLAGMASSIKPTFAPLGIALLAMVSYVLWRRGVGIGRYVLYGLAGFAIALGINLVFLLQHHALGPFWFVLRTITPSYVALAPRGFGDLLKIAVPKGLLLLALLIGLPLAVLNRGWDWERWALLLAGAFGLMSYFLQAKGFLHHRYTFETVLLLLLGIELTRGLQRPGWPRLLGSIGIVTTLLAFAPHYLVKMHRVPGDSVLTKAMEADLGRLGGDRLQGQVQCFDLVFGCLNSLYHLGLVENTGFTGDLLFFTSSTGRAVDFYREMFWRSAERDPANVLVMSNEWFQRPNSFHKVDSWPEFRQYLNTHYTLVEQREFPAEELSFPTPEGGEIAAYRIYIRNGTPLLRSAAAALKGPEPAKEEASR